MCGDPMIDWPTTEYRPQPDTCPHCRVRFLEDKLFQAEIRNHAIRYGTISATLELNERYMEWHDDGHEKVCPVCEGQGGWMGPADNTDIDICYRCEGEGTIRER